MTDFIIFVDVGESRWQEAGRISASGRQTAIRSYLSDDGERPLGVQGPHYVAVPVRSWKPVTVKAETKTMLRFS